MCGRGLNNTFDIEVVGVSFEDEEPITIEKCEDPEAEIYTFDLGENSELQDIISQEFDLSEIDISYYTSEAAAENEDENEEINSETPFETEEENTSIWVRVSTDIGCSDIKEVILLVNFSPETLVEELSLQTCLGNWFNLEEDVISQIVENPEDIDFAFYESEEDAENQEGEIEDTDQYETTTEETIFVRIEEAGNSCFKIIPITLETVESPELGELEDLYFCDDDLSGVAIFDLTQNNQNAIPEGGNAEDYTVEYYLSEEDAQNEENIIENPGSFENEENPETIYVRLTHEELGCFGVDSFELIVTPSG